MVHLVHFNGVTGLLLASCTHSLFGIKCPSPTIDICAISKLKIHLLDGSEFFPTLDVEEKGSAANTQLKQPSGEEKIWQKAGEISDLVSLSIPCQRQQKETYLHEQSKNIQIPHKKQWNQDWAPLASDWKEKNTPMTRGCERLETVEWEKAFVSPKSQPSIILLAISSSPQHCSLEGPELGWASHEI